MGCLNDFSVIFLLCDCEVIGRDLNKGLQRYRLNVQSNPEAEACSNPRGVERITTIAAMWSCKYGNLVRLLMLCAKLSSPFDFAIV